MLNHVNVWLNMTDTALECAVPSGSHTPQNPYARLVSTMARQHRLLSVHWELTYRCNETCTHCYLDVFKPNARAAQIATGHKQLSAQTA